MIRPLFDRLGPDQRVQVALRMRAFIEDPIVKELFDRMQRDAYDGFLHSAPGPQRDEAHAEAVVTERFLTELRGLIAAGTQRPTSRS